MELWRSLAALVEAPAVEHAELARLLELGEPPSTAEHGDLFLFQLYPYASVYLGAEGALGGEARDRVAGFLRALGLDPRQEPDHLSSLLATYAGLNERAKAGEDKASNSLWARAQAAFLHEHVLSWLPAYLLRLDELASSFYRRWGSLLLEVLAAERRQLGPPPKPAVALAGPTTLADPREDGAAAFLTSLLAPGRSGLILTRDDLLRCARETGLGARIGERRYALEALLSQGAGDVFRWLAREAGRQGSSLIGALGGEFPEVAEPWRLRAERSQGLLLDLASDLPVEEPAAAASP